MYSHKSMNNYQIDRAAWAQYGIFEQMGNISSEVGRAIAAYRLGNEKRFEGALARAIDLFSATAELLARQQSPRLREVLVARDQFLALFYEGTFDSDADAIERYFNAFAIAARKGA